MTAGRRRNRCLLTAQADAGCRDALGVDQCKREIASGLKPLLGSLLEAALDDALDGMVRSGVELAQQLRFLFEDGVHRLDGRAAAERTLAGEHFV